MLIGALVTVASLLVLAGGRVSGGQSGASAPTAGVTGTPGAAPGDGTHAVPGGPPAGRVPDPLPGESADEYRWRAEAAQLRSQARDALERVLNSATVDAVLQAQLESVAAIMDHEAEADAQRQKARASALSGTSSGPVIESSGTGAGGLTTVVGLIGALGGFLTAVAGLLTAWLSWRKAAAAR